MKDININDQSYSQSEARAVDKHILVFRTNINTAGDLEGISMPVSQLPGIIRWNVNLEDPEKILRIESSTDISNQVIETIKSNGYSCEELPD
jgi:hypothetical protein